MPEEAKEVKAKPGWRSSEFWIKMFVVLGGMLLASGALGEATGLYQLLTFALAALASMGYTAGRSYVKATELKASAIKSGKE